MGVSLWRSRFAISIFTTSVSKYVSSIVAKKISVRMEVFPGLEEKVAIVASQ